MICVFKASICFECLGSAVHFLALPGVGWLLTSIQLLFLSDQIRFNLKKVWRFSWPRPIASTTSIGLVFFIFREKKDLEAQLARGRTQNARIQSPSLTQLQRDYPPRDFPPQTARPSIASVSAPSNYQSAPKPRRCESALSYSSTYLFQRVKALNVVSEGCV